MAEIISMLPEKDVILAVLDKTALGFCRLKGMNDVGHVAPGAGKVSIQFEDWDWEVGVGLYGLFRQAEFFSDDATMAALADWYDRKITEGLPPRHVNSTAPLLTLACLYKRRPNERWREVLYDWADWMYKEHPRTEDRGCQHTVREGPNTGQLWDDTLFMASLFMAHAGKLFSMQSWTDDAVYQFIVHERYLADPETGLWFHGWTFEGQHNFARALWARGNAWVTAAIPEILKIAPDMDKAAHDCLSLCYRQQAAALARRQTMAGMWRTLLDDASSPLEASATAGIAYGLLLGQEAGLIGGEFDRVIDKAVAAIVGCVDGAGIVHLVSDGTPVGRDLEFYRKIPNVPAPYGQSLASLMLLQTLKSRYD